MKTTQLPKLALALLALVPLSVLALDSGSTGSDDVFNPSVNTERQVPASGVFNFTTVNIPSGVKVTFKKNATNTPVVILATGDVTIAGTIDISGGNAAAAGAAGDGNIGDDGVPGLGGPGGYDGGRGGAANYGRAGAGIGPGAGAGGHGCATSASVFGGPATVGGAGAGFGTAGIALTVTATFTCSGTSFVAPAPGATYGSSQLLPLVGGSGGGGAAGGPSFAGSGGGGGGGSILIAANGTVTVTGSVLANGGKGGDTSGAGAGANGGGGSGGAIRIIARAIAGNGTISATGGAVGARTSTSGPTYVDGSAAGTGRIRLESETFTRTAATTPAYTFSQPGLVFVAGLPTLRISRVAGTDAPLAPTGNGDVVLPASTLNPVTVEFATTGVPVGNTVKLTVTPPSGLASTVVSGALTGTTQSASASVSVTLPAGPSILSAQTTYTIVAALGDELSRYANNERVEKVRLEAAIGGTSSVTLITASGNEYRVPQAVLAGLGG
jgi:hypothetical protein